jgi:hypothetical protein
MKTIRKFFAVCMLTELSLGASAHLLDVEEQNMDRTGQYNEYGQEILESRSKPWKDRSGDASFYTPHRVKNPILDSQAIFSWLDADDVDVYSFTLTFGDVSQGTALGFGGGFVTAAPVPPACNQTKNRYPSIALIAPFGTAPVQDPTLFNLPFAVPPGHGVLVTHNTHSASRVIFELPAEDTEVPLNLSWFLPNGCQVEPYFNCQQSDSLGSPLFAPGTTYYLAVWSPEGTPMDYTLNLGVDESNIMHFENIEDLVQDNNHLHTPCTEPSFDGE